LPDDFEGALLDVSLSQDRAVIREAVGDSPAGGSFNDVADAAGGAEISRSAAESEGVVSGDHDEIEVAEFVELQLRCDVRNVNAAGEGVSRVDDQAGEDPRLMVEDEEALGVFIESPGRCGDRFAARGRVRVEDAGELVHHQLLFGILFESDPVASDGTEQDDECSRGDKKGGAKTKVFHMLILPTRKVTDCLAIISPARANYPFLEWIYNASLNSPHELV